MSDNNLNVTNNSTGESAGSARVETTSNGKPVLVVNLNHDENGTNAMRDGFSVSE